MSDPYQQPPFPAAPVPHHTSDDDIVVLREPERRRLNLAWVIPVATVLLLAVFGAGWYGGSAFTEQQQADSERRAATSQQTEQVQRLQAAHTTCDDTGAGTTVADNGQTLTVDGKGSTDFSGLQVGTLNCVLEVLGVPEAVKRHMFATRALDGRQTDSWEAYTASWSYHPDNGLDLIVRVA